MSSSPSPRSRVYFTWRKTARNVAALLAFAIIAFLGILGESIGSPQTRHLCAFGLVAGGHERRRGIRLAGSPRRNRLHELRRGDYDGGRVAQGDRAVVATGFSVAKNIS